MPLIIMTGLPCSGKSTRTAQIKKYFEDIHQKVVAIVSEYDLVSDLKMNKSDYCFDTVKEKQVRSQMKSNVQRMLKPDVIIILDAGNYIKGYRYELYCLAKHARSTHCIVECDSISEKSWNLNESRNVDDQYTRQAFDSLVGRQEAPNCWNRWDKPLITIQLDDTLPGDQIYSALYNRKPPKPNQSTQNIPSCSSNYLYNMDCVIQEVCDEIMAAKEGCSNGEDIQLAKFKNCVIKQLDVNLTSKQLAQYRKQFLSLNKLKPFDGSNDDTAVAFVQFMNSSMHQYVPGLFK